MILQKLYRNIFGKDRVDEKLSTLPVLLRNPKILLIGGGKVALQKAEVLQTNEIDFTIISENFVNEFEKIERTKRTKSFEKNDLLNYNIVIDATRNKSVERIIENSKKEKFFLLNTVDIPHKCDFYFSALLNYGKLKVAVSSDGASPTISQLVRNKIKQVIPNEIEHLIEKKHEQRLAGNIDINSTKAETLKVLGKVYFIGAGTGDPELITVKGRKALDNCDVVLHDHLVSKELLNTINPKIEMINCGKPHGEDTLKQQDINHLLLEKALQGKTVVRLKGGDPFVFGRLTEEVSFLKENEINFEIIPGISSAIYGPGSADIPVTSREVSHGFSVVSGCLAKNKFNKDWIKLLKIPNHTTVVLMGLKKISEIVKHAVEEKIRKDLPAAIVSNATLPNQKEIITTLGNLEIDSQTAETPAVIVFGDVVNLKEIIKSSTAKSLFKDAV